MTDEVVALVWQRFSSFISARDACGAQSCVYVQADSVGHPVRVGLATAGLHKRYWGGTGWAVEAAMHGSGNFWFFAAIPRDLCALVESTLIWEWRNFLPYNQVGKLNAPTHSTVRLYHEGDPPVLPESN